MEIEITVESRLAFAHYGYIYALATVSRPDGSVWLISGSGDCDVKIWLAHPQGGLQLIRHFTGLQGAVHSFAVRDSLLYAGQQDGEIKVWDLETSACIRSIQAHEADVLTMSVLGQDVYTAAADGQVLRVDERFDCTASWRAHSGIILSSTLVDGKEKGRWELITAGNDSYIKVSRVFTHQTSS
jgi:di- and tripeptidase